MNNEEIKTTEAAPETPVAAPTTDPRKYFLKSNIFRAVTVALMAVCVIFSLFLPVFSVNIGEDAEDAITFSIMDIVSDLGDEFTLCFADEMDPENWDDIAEIYKDPGNFTQAVDATVIGLLGNDSPLADMVSSFAESRILIMIPYFLLLMPVIFVVGLAISTIMRLIQVIISFVKPTTQIKKTDASSCIVVTIFIAVCYLVHFFYSCFSLNFVSVGLLLAVSIGAVVMNFIYRKHTKDIVDAKFGM